MRVQKTDLVIFFLTALVCASVIILVFLPTFKTPFLLDEQQLSMWARSLVVEGGDDFVRNLLDWNGPGRADFFAPLGTLAVLLGNAGALSFLPARTGGILLHALNTMAVFFLAYSQFGHVPEKETEGSETIMARTNKAVRSVPWVAAAAALLFGVSPLAAEASVYLGGRAMQTATFFFLLSLIFYIIAPPVREKEEKTEGRAVKSSRKPLFKFWSVFFFALCLITFKSAWILASAFAAYEVCLLAVSTTRRESLRERLKEKGPGGLVFDFLPMILILTLAMLSVVFLSLSGNINATAMVDDFRRSLLTLLFPINRAIFAKYSLQIRFLFVLYPFVLAGLLVATAVNQKARSFGVFLIALLFISILAFGKGAVPSSDFYDARFLYLSAAPFSIILSIGIFGAYIAVRQLPPLTAGAGLALSILFFLIFARQTATQVKAYEKASSVLSRIQLSAKILALKEKQPFVLARDVERAVAFQPLVSPYKVFVMDGETGLMRSPLVSGGFLKESLRAGDLRSVTARWDQQAESLIPVSVNPERNDPPFVLDAQAVANRLSPPLGFWKTVYLAPDRLTLSVSSNSTNEPGIRLAPGELSPLDGDFMKVTASISTPVAPKNANVEVHWLTTQWGSYEKEDRSAGVESIRNDNKFHDYLLSLRGTGWSTNGMITMLTLGFPSSANVELKKIEIIPKNGIIPRVSVKKNEMRGRKTGDFSLSFYRFPNDERLGLFSLKRSGESLLLSYDVAGIDGASSALIEASGLDNRLVSENGDEPLEDAIWRRRLGDSRGSVVIYGGDLGTPGIYKIRVVGLDDDGEPIGRFSDFVYCLVER